MSPFQGYGSSRLIPRGVAPGYSITPLRGRRPSGISERNGIMAHIFQVGKPWTLGEVLSGGIGGFVHLFKPGGACYGCVASHLKRNVVEEAPPGKAPDYSQPGGPVEETRVPANKASIETIAGLHASL